jgi:prepilin-type N-terminal cleavage/methylation domain-containing protein
MDQTPLSRRGFTLVELLVVISIIAIIAGLVVPVLLSGRGKAYQVQCISNLRQLCGAASQFADKKNYWPIDTKSSEPRAHDSLNVLLRSSYGENLEPEHFDCPAGDGVRAEVDAESEGTKGPKFLLDESSNDYAWIGKRLSMANTKRRPVGADKYYADQAGEEHGGHSKCMIVVYTDSSTKALEDEELPEDLPDGLVR